MIFVVAVAVGSLALLAHASDQLVDGASSLAGRLRVSPLVVGVVLMGFGTSMPELLVSGLAASRGSPDLGVGNILGSNVANLTLVLGVAALVLPVSVSSSALRREGPLAALACGLFAVLVWDGLSLVDGLVLAAALVVALALLLYSHHREASHEEPEPSSVPAERSTGRGALAPALRATAGLAGTLVGAHLLVWSGLETARILGLAEGFVGLSLVAVGTSLPELATAAQAARKGEGALVVGNLLGSNLFNSLAVGAAVGCLGGAPLESLALCHAAVGLMVVVVVISYVLMATGRLVERWEAIVLLGLYLAALPLLVP